MRFQSEGFIPFFLGRTGDVAKGNWHPRAIQQERTEERLAEFREGGHSRGALPGSCLA